MSGLILLVALVFCLWACVWIAKSLGNLVPNPTVRTVVKCSIFIALLASPFVDEVIGKHQFEELCKANGIEGADVSKAKGKRVRGEYGERRLVSGTIMPIEESDVLFRDADSNELLIQYKNYYAHGGWLMRYTPLSMGSPHSMLFPGNGCGFIQRDRIFMSNQISQIKK